MHTDARMHLGMCECMLHCVMCVCVMWLHVSDCSLSKMHKNKIHHENATKSVWKWNTCLHMLLFNIALLLASIIPHWQHCCLSCLLWGLHIVSHFLWYMNQYADLLLLHTCSNNKCNNVFGTIIQGTIFREFADEVRDVLHNIFLYQP